MEPLISLKINKIEDNLLNIFRQKKIVFRGNLIEEYRRGPGSEFRNTNEEGRDLHVEQ